MALQALATRALSTAKRDGASQAEAFAVTARTLSVYIDDNKIKIVEEKVDQGLAMRVLKSRKMAQASSSCIAPEEAEACAKAASRLADQSPATKNYDRLPAPTRATLSPRTWDEDVASLDPRHLVELVKATVGAATDQGVKIPKGVMRAATIESTVMNTNGLEVAHRYTLVFADFNAMADGPSPGEGISTFNSPWLKEYDPVRTGTNLARQAMAARDAKPLNGSLKVPVLIAPGELGDMLDSSVGFAISAESVSKKRSPWAGSTGAKVASEVITMVDDPSESRGALSAGYDDEGVPTTVKPIIENGVLRTFLYDSYNSAVAGRPPSGNGVRRSSRNTQYLFQNPVGCGCLNLVLRPGTRTPEQIIASLDDGVVVEKFAFPTVNPFTGAFALEARLAHVVKSGSVVGQIKHALVVGNMYEGLKNVLEIGSDLTVVGPMMVPTVAFNGFEAIGSQ